MDFLAGLRVCTSYSDKNLIRRKKRWVTKPKRNADFRAKPKGLCIFMKSQNLMDLALDNKNKTKQ